MNRNYYSRTNEHSKFTKGPYETFKNLGERIRQSKYRNTSIPFIVNASLVSIKLCPKMTGQCPENIPSGIRF